MARFEQEKQQIKEVPIERWDQIAADLALQDGYTPNLIPQNFPLVIDKLGITIQNIDAATMREFLDRSNFEGIAADKLAALSRGDIVWFKDLQKRTSED